MAEGIQLRLTHAQRALPSPPYTAGTVRTSSILIDDIRESENQRGLVLPRSMCPSARRRSHNNGTYGSSSMSIRVTTTGAETIDVRLVTSASNLNVNGRSLIFTKVRAI